MDFQLPSETSFFPTSQPLWPKGQRKWRESSENWILFLNVCTATEGKRATYSLLQQANYLCLGWNGLSVQSFIYIYIYIHTHIYMIYVYVRFYTCVYVHTHKHVKIMGLTSDSWSHTSPPTPSYLPKWTRLAFAFEFEKEQKTIVGILKNSFKVIGISDMIYKIVALYLFYFSFYYAVVFLYHFLPLASM